MASDAFEAIAEDFTYLDDWQERYRYILDLAKEMPPLPDELRTAATKVEGCASQVWIVPEIKQKSGSKIFYFQGDSDALIVRGLIAVLRSLYAGLPLNEVACVNAEAELRRLGLRGHLTAQRSNGLTAMVKRIQTIVGILDEGNSGA